MYSGACPLYATAHACVRVSVCRGEGRACVCVWVGGWNQRPIQNLLLPDLTPKLNDTLDMVGWKDRHQYSS